MQKIGFPLNLDSEGIQVRIPLPPEDLLLDMLFKHRETGQGMCVVFEVQFDADFCERMLDVHRNKASRDLPANVKREGSD